MASFHVRLVRRLLPASLAALLLAPPAIADPGAWSFADHPHPDAAGSALDDIPGFIGETSRDFYDRRVDAAFARYRALYPAYGETERDEAAKDAWTRHVLTRGADPLAEAVKSALNFEFLDLMAPMADSDFLYCGRWTRAPKTATEERFKTVVNHLAAFAEVGGPDAVLNLATLRHSPNIAFNPDLTYYFAALSRLETLRSHEAERRGHGSLPRTRDPHVARLAALLPQHRLDTLDRALGTNDFAAIFDTTGPCIQPTEPPTLPL